MFKFLRSKKGQGMVEYGLIIAMVAIAAMIGLHSLGDNNANRTMEIAETLDEAGDTYSAESKDLENKESIKNYNSGNGGYYSGGGGGGLGSFPSYSGGVNWKPSVKEDGTTDENDRIGTIDKEATEDAPVLNDDAPEGNQAPIASFYVVNSKNLTVGETLTLYNTSTDPDGDAIVKEEWDGLPSGNKFTIEGSYPIKLRVVDEWGNWSQWATVTVEIKNKKPVAIITSSPNFSDGDEFDKTEYFTWSSSSSYDPDGHKIIEEEWDDKRNSYSAGEYTVRLRVKDEYGLWSEWTEKHFTIFDGSRPVIIGGTVSDAKGQNWSTDIISQTEADIPQIVSPKDIYFKTVLDVVDEDRDDINAIQYRIDGNLQTTLYNITSDGGDAEEKTITSNSSSGVPQNNTLTFGQHSLEIRIRDTSGAWSNWTDPFYVEVINVKEETDDENQEVTQYMTMEIYNYNKTSQSAMGGNKGPWFAGDFVIIPEDKTGAEIKDAVIEIDGTEITSEFTSIAGQPVVLFNYTTEGTHVLKAKFLDENDVWSSYVENNNFTINKINISATLTTYHYCLGDNCSSYNYLFSTDNTGTNTDKTMPQNSISYFDEYSLTYSNSAGISLGYLNIKVNETVTKVTPTILNTSGSANTTMYYYGDMYSSTGFPTISYTSTTPAVVSFQIVDANGNTSDWTNTITLMPPVADEQNVLTDTTVSNLRVPTVTTIPGWNLLFENYDDGSETITLSDGKKINFGGTDYSSITVTSNGKISFTQSWEDCSSQNVSDSCTNHSIVMISKNNLRSNAYYRHTTNGIDVLWAYEHYSESTFDFDSYMMVSLNADGSGSAYFLDEQLNYLGNSNPTIFVKLSSSNYSELNNPLTANSAFTWTKTNDTPYYALTSGGTIPADINTNVVTENLPVYLNGTKISNTLRFDSDAMADYSVYDIAGNITLVNTTTNTTFNSTFTSNYDEYCDYYDCYYYYTMDIAEIPGITPGEYTISIDTPYINHSWSDSQLGAVLTNNTTPLTITLTNQPTTITNITLSETKDFSQFSVYTNNNGSRKDAMELSINNVSYIQKTDLEEAKNTENSFFFEGTSNEVANIKIYNSLLTPGATITVKTRMHLEATDTWTEWFEKELTIPAMTISSVNVSSKPNQGTSTITTYLNNYANKTLAGVKVKINDITATEDTSLTTVNNGNFTKDIPLLTEGTHSIKVIAMYKLTSDSTETIYETVEYTRTYTQPSYTPLISSISSYTTSGTNYVYRIYYSNTYSVPMYTKKYIVKINDIDVSDKITLYNTNSNPDYINIPMSLFSNGSNTIKVKTQYRPQNNLFLDLSETNEGSTTRTISAPYISSLSVDTSSTNNSNGEYLYFTVGYSNETKQNITSLVLTINEETVTGTEITSTNSNKTQSTVRIPMLDAGSYTIKATATFADGTVSERTLSHTINTPTSKNYTMSHGNTTSNAKEYLYTRFYLPYKYNFTKEDFKVTFNGSTEAIPISHIETSISSGSYSTDNGTMKYRYYVYVYLDDYLYREGTNTINLVADVLGTEIPFTLTETNGTISYPYNYYTQTDNFTDPTKLIFKTRYYSSYYYRVESLKIQEFSDSNRTNLINEYTVANTNTYKYVGSTITNFSPIPITNPSETHYYKLSFITPWGTESSKINYTYSKKEPAFYSFNNADYYTKDDMWNPRLYITVYDNPGVSKIEMKFDSSDTVYSASSSVYTYNSGSTVFYASFSNVTNPQSSIPNATSSDSTSLKWRIQYSNGTYSEWKTNTTSFYYPYLNSISEIINEDSIINNIPALKIKVSGYRFTSAEEFTPEVVLDGIPLPVLKTQYSSSSTYYVWVEQPESGIYNNLSLKFGYNNRYTNTISKTNIAIYEDEHTLLDIIPITRTENTSIPTYVLSEYTKITDKFNSQYSSGSYYPKITLTTPINFLGEESDIIRFNAGSISLQDGSWYSTDVNLDNSSNSSIKNYINSLSNKSIAFLSNAYYMKPNPNSTESGLYYKETTTTVNILYKDVYISDLFSASSSFTPFIDIFITINKSDGSGSVYYGDMNPNNSSEVLNVYTTTGDATARLPRTFIVRDTVSEYGYLKPWYTDVSSVNVDTMYSNVKISWNSEYSQELPPVITDISYARVSDEKIDVTLKFTSRSETTTVTDVNILPETLTWESFEQTANDTIIIRGLDVPTTDGTTMFATITVDDLVSTMKPFVMLLAPTISSVEHTSDNETENVFTFTITNTTNADVLSATPFVIKSRTTGEEIEVNIKNTVITNNSIIITTDLLPQDYYWLSLDGTYQDIGEAASLETFTASFNTTLQDFSYNVNSGPGTKTYLMREIEYPAGGISTSTSGYTQFTYGYDSYTYKLSLPSGKKINYANNNYSYLYLGWDGYIGFENYYSSHAPKVSYSSAGKSIIPLGGIDTDTYGWYKFVEDGVEILYKYSHYSYSPNGWIKVKINYHDGSGQIYFIGNPGTGVSDRLSNLEIGVKVSSTDYAHPFDPGTGTISSFTNKAYEWYRNENDFTTITVGSTTSGVKTYVMSEIPFPTSISTSTSGFTTLATDTDYYNSTISLPTGKTVNFAGTQYNTIYALTDGALSFLSSGNSSHGAAFNNVRNLTISPIAGQDTRLSAYYKFVDDGIEFLYKYSYWSGHSPNAWVKTKINYDGTGQIYYIGGLGSGLNPTNMQSFIKVSNTDYDYAISPGSATYNTFINKAYKWEENASFEDIPTITNITTNTTTLNGGKDTKFTITSNKPLTNIELYVGTNNYSFSEITEIAENTYEITAPIPNNLTTSTIQIKVKGEYKNVSSYWKTVSFPYSQSSTPTIVSLTDLPETIKQEANKTFTINYTKSALNNNINSLTIKYVKSNGESIELIPENWSVIDNTHITVTNLSFKNIPITTGSLKLQIKDEANTYSDIYLFPLEIIANETPIITSINTPSNLTGRDGIPHRRDMTFTINYSDVENDEIKQIYYRTKQNNSSSWTSWTTITLPNDNIEIIGSNTIKVNITTPSNTTHQRDYQFKIKDNFNESNISETTTVNILENTPPVLTDLVTIPETAVGSKIELTAPYTDIDLEEDAISEFYVYVDGDLTTRYQTAYTDGYNIKIRNLLVDKVGEYNISLVVKDKYNKTSNKVDVPIKVLPSDAPILYSYKLDEVILNKDLLLKDIYYQLSETATGITAIEYTIDGNEPIVIDLDEPITTNNFSYTLLNTAFTEPSNDIKYINVRIKDDTGTWSAAIMGTFIIGYNQTTTTNYNIYVDWIDYYGNTFTNENTKYFDIYGYGFSSSFQFVPTINGEEHPEILNNADIYYSDIYTSYDFSQLATPLTASTNYELGFVLKDLNNETIFTYSFGNFTYIDVSNNSILTNNTNAIKTSINTNTYVYAFLHTNYYDEIGETHYLEPIITIDGVNTNDYSYYLYDWWPQDTPTLYTNIRLTPKTTIDSNIKLKYNIRDYDTDSIIETTNEISIPILITETQQDLYTLSLSSISYFKNKTINKTTPNVVAGNIHFSIYYQNRKTSEGIDKFEMYIDDATEPFEISTPSLTENSSTHYKYGYIGGEFIYTEAGEHTFKFIITNKEGETSTLEITRNIIPDTTIKINATKSDGSTVNINELIELEETDTTLIFTLESSNPEVTYTNMKLEVNNVVYDFSTGTATVDFSKINQGYYRVRLVADTNLGEKVSSNEIQITDFGVNSIMADWWGSNGVINITFPNSVYLFGQSYQTLYFSGWGGFSTDHFNYDVWATSSMPNYNNYLQPVSLQDDYNTFWNSAKLNRILYKTFTDNTTIYIDATDNQGNRVYYAISFYNRDNVKFTYYIINGTTAQTNAAGIRVDEDNLLYTNNGTTQKINNNTSVLIDTFNMATI